MTQAPSPKEALENARKLAQRYVDCTTDDMPPEIKMPTVNELGDALCTLLATLQPSGERREAIARIIEPGAWADYDEKGGDNGRTRRDREWSLERASTILASGLVQDEAGWRDISTAPKDGTPFIGAFWSIRWADSHRKGDVVTCWWQPEFEAFISACREMSLAPGLTFENGETRQLHSPVIEPVTHWMPLDRPVIRSARDGGAS